MVGSTKKDERVEETRTRILDAAQTLFATHGFNATTTKAIAERAKVPGGLVFYYFPTKQALLISIVSERNILSELQSVREALVVSDPREALIALALRYLNALKQHKELACIMLREFRSQAEIASQFHALREEHIQFITSFLQEALHIEEDEQAEERKVIARLFFYNLIVIGLIEEATDLPLHFVENMVDVLLCRLAKTA
jgi:AcrR family transcriptional regulator